MQATLPEISKIARYDRQKRIEGWNQEKLEDARVGIIGSGSLAQLAALPLAALGFGHIEIYDTGRPSQGKRDNLICAWSKKGSDKAKSLEEMLKKVNPNVDARGMNMRFDYASQASLLGGLDLIIDCTNDPCSKLIALEYGQRIGTPVISAASSSESGEISVSIRKFDEKYLFPEYKAQEQSAATSMVIGGLVADEARKLIMPMNDHPLDRIVSYNLRSKDRTGYANDEMPGEKQENNSHVVLVGAGALGNFVGLGLAIMGVKKLTVFDDDVVEETNLNRQVLFYDAVGEHKAEALIEKLKKINPDIKYEYCINRVGTNFGKYLKANKPALIIDSVDNFKTRALLNYYASTMQIPLISGGTDFKSGGVTVYVPGKTSCLQCQLTIDDLALQNFKPQRCIYAAEPSVITSNQIVGGMIVNEAGAVLEQRSEPIHGVLKYSSTDAVRIGMLGSRGACDCNNKPKEFYTAWLRKMGKLYAKGV